MSDEANLSRRRFLTVATGVTGAVGVGVAAIPFVASWKPSARAQALGAPVQVDASKLEPGAMVRVEWRGRPVMVVRRTPEMLARLAETEDQLDDPASLKSEQPEYAVNQARSIRPEILVIIGNCTHLGCAPTPRFEVGGELGADWPGGFFCPCHGSKFDLSGRVWAGVPAPTNLVVPPYRFLRDELILIGDDTGVSA